MNENDGRDREVREYVRNRMAADMPPEFTGDVMNDVQRTPQRRRGFGWRPALTGLVTVAGAAAIVIVGLNLIYREPVGSDSTPTPAPSVTVAPSATELPSSTPSAEPTTSQGEFGPIYSMAPEDAFANAQTCENLEGTTTVGGPSDVSYSLSIPADWYTNAGTETHPACTLFAPVPFDEGSDGAIPDEVVIIADLPPGGDYSTDGNIDHNHFTVDGVAAERYKFPVVGDAFAREPMVVWIIAVAGNLPAEGNDQPYLILSTHSSDPAELAAWADVLDRMVATLDIGE